MDISKDALRKLGAHWAVQAAGKGEQDSLVIAYEIAAMEGVDAVLHPTPNNHELRDQCIAGAYRVFELRGLVDMPEQVDERIFHILRLSALAACGESWSDLRQWYYDIEGKFQVSSVPYIPWDQWVLGQLFGCWISIFHKNHFYMYGVEVIIDGLRDNQAEYEPNVLNNSSNAENQCMALRLVAMYHWARCTELLAEYMLHRESTHNTVLLDKHFEFAISAAARCGDMKLEILLRWLHVASHQMLISSTW